VSKPETQVARGGAQMGRTTYTLVDSGEFDEAQAVEEV